MHLNYKLTLTILLGLLTIISLIAEIESCGGGGKGGKGGKGGGGKWGKKKDWGKKKKDKKAKKVLSGFVSSSRYGHGYEDEDDGDDYHVKSSRHHYYDRQQPSRIIEKHYIEVPRYVETTPTYRAQSEAASIVQKPTIDQYLPITTTTTGNNYNYGSSSAIASASTAALDTYNSDSYVLQRQPTSQVVNYDSAPIKERIEYEPIYTNQMQPTVAKTSWPSRHPILSALFRKIVED